ncbi:MAG: Na+/H+ antiporter NhaC family protein [bacterium]
MPWWAVLTAPLRVLGGPDGPKLIVLTLFILFIGGSFAVLDRGGVLPALLARLAARYEDRRRRLLLVNVVAFALIGSTLGILEEIVPLILLYVPLARRFGWDPRVGMAIPFLSAGMGFSAATFNPFTVGTAQKLAGLPLFSGLGLRLAFLVVTITLVALFLLWRTRGDHAAAAPEALTPPPLARPRATLAWLAGGLALVLAIVLAGTRVEALQALAFPLIGLVFVAMGIGGGLIAGVAPRRVFGDFTRGLAAFAPAVALILLAGSVGLLISEAGVMATLVARLAALVDGWSQSAAAVAIYLSQMLVNLAVPSGTGQAVLTIPVLAPLGDLIGLSRQTIVLAFQCGDGFSNMLWPTNPMLLIALGLARVSWRDWFVWVLPLQLALAAASVGVLLVAVAIGYH